METWPLQLKVSSRATVYVVSLTETTEIRKAGRSVAASALVPGAEITLLGHRSPAAVGAADTVIAEAITVT